MASERWSGRPPTGAIDIWALGVTLHELVTGRRPIADRDLAASAFSRAPLALPEFPGAPWAELVRDCLSNDPAQRPSATDVSHRIASMLDPRTAAASEARSPFPGLATFAREDAAYYFGREAEINALLEALRHHALVPIIGPSGIGSFFVRAGLLPRLEETNHWKVVELRPGARPFESLARALGVPGDVTDSLREHPDALSLILERLAREAGQRILIFVDQFEETFTLSDDSLAFVECLGRVARADEPWRIALTLRNDFLGQLTEASAMRVHLGAVMPLAPLSLADLQAAIVGPLAKAGYATDDAELPRRIVADVASQPVCLPLLQFACHALWERRDTAARMLLDREYRAMGGATGALASHAQQLLAEMTSEDVRLVRRILLALIHPDGTRHPRLRDELVADLADDRGQRVVDRLLERRLIVATRDAEVDAALLEIAHEALATAWPQLARWLDETYEERVLVSEIELASTLWERRGKRDDETWAGAALAEAVRKVRDWNITLPSAPRAFIDASLSRDVARRRRHRWLVIGASASLAFVAVASVIAAVAFREKQREAIESRERLQRSLEERQLAAADMGVFDLELEPFDWDAAHHRAVPTDATLHWSLRAVDRVDRRLPGKPYADRLEIRRGTPVRNGHDIVETVEARSSAAFLEIDRGACAPSEVFLQHLPGYSERATRRTLHIKVPTCAASTADTIAIPDGAFVFNREDPDASKHDVSLDLPAFRIDWTEVTRAAFELFQELEPLTGEGTIDTAYLDANTPRSPLLPAVGIDYFTARAYCRYLGKDLPSVEQWQKAFRGGASIRGAPNPKPDRVTPWLVATSARPANLAGDIAPVGTYPDDTSPYGVVDLAGNASEWTSAMSVDRTVQGLRTVLGATWDTPWDLGQEQITWRNARADRYLDFQVGFRCSFPEGME